MSDQTHSLVFERDTNLGQHSGGVENRSEELGFSDHASNRNGIFARLIDALRGSRRLQAARVMRDYRHLVQDQSKW